MPESYDILSDFMKLIIYILFKLLKQTRLNKFNISLKYANTFSEVMLARS